MSRLRFLVASAVLATGIAVAPGASPSADAATTAITAFVWDGSEGGSPGHGIEDTFIDGQDGVTMTVTGTSQGVTAHFDSTNPARRIRYGEVRLVPPRGSRLTPGTYENATRAELGPEPGPGMSAASDNSGCNQLQGRFVVEEASFDPTSDAVRRFAAHFAQDCELHPPTLFGQVRFNSTLPFAARRGGPSAVPFMAGDVAQTVERTVTVISDGTTALTTGQAGVSSTEAGGSFVVVDDQCRQRTLPRGESCQITVRYEPHDADPHAAVLTLADNTARGARTWTLNGDVSDGPPAPNPPEAGAGQPGDVLVIDRSEYREGHFQRTFRSDHQGETITVDGTAFGVHIAGRSPSRLYPDSFDSAGFTLRPASGGDRLEAGRQYLGARGTTVPEGATPGLLTNFCDRYGAFSIYDIAYDPSGNVSRLAAAWVAGCSDVGPFEFGEVRWHSSVPVAARHIEPDAPGLYMYLNVQGDLPSVGLTIDSEGTAPLELGQVEIKSDHPENFEIRNDACSGRRVEPGDHCTVEVHYTPVDPGLHDGFVVIPDNTASGGAILPLGANADRRVGDPPGMTHGSPGQTGGAGPPAHIAGYWMVGTDGAVYGFGDAKNLGNAAVGKMTAVDLEPTPSGNGYWIVDEAGTVLQFGDAAHHGNVDRSKLSPGEKATSLSATADGGGYWVFTNRGRVLTFGNAPFLGDVSTVSLNGPVLDSIVTPSGRGYYMVASDGGAFTFGDAVFYGAMGGQKLNAPVQSLVPDADGTGYWLVAADGGIFAFKAQFKGSLGDVRLNKPVTGMVRAGGGYLMVGEDGGIFDFSGDPNSFKGSLGAKPPAKPITSVALLERR